MALYIIAMVHIYGRHGLAKVGLVMSILIGVFELILGILVVIR